VRPPSAQGISLAGLSSLAYGEDRPPLDDPAEAYHEASKTYPSFASRQMPGVAILERDKELQGLAARSARRHAHRPTIALPDTGIPEASLRTVLTRRRSSREFRTAPVPLAQLGSLLRAAYGVTAAEEWAVRAAPSGGALYPLELYPLALQGGDLPVGVYHYDPFGHALEALRSTSAADELRQALVQPELAQDAALFVAVTAIFWRARFKYGLRGYRFALLEAGHVVQNLLLAASALGLGAVPVGGYYDCRLDDLLGCDGVHEATVYGVIVGVRGSEK
jgi:SagB-type dehydrogenase family enzyme